MFNLMVVMGVIPIFNPIVVPAQSRLIQMPIMLGITLILLPVLKYQQGIKRWTGIVLLGVYIVFTVCMYYINRF